MPGTARWIASSRRAVVRSRLVGVVDPLGELVAARGEGVEHDARVLDRLAGRALLRVQDLEHLVRVLRERPAARPRNSENSGAVALRSPCRGPAARSGSPRASSCRTSGRSRRARPSGATCAVSRRPSSGILRRVLVPGVSSTYVSPSSVFWRRIARAVLRDRRVLVVQLDRGVGAAVVAEVDLLDLADVHARDPHVRLLRQLRRLGEEVSKR